jgi:hypothetical protein
VPADNPLWTAQENEGDWPTLDDTPDTIVVEAPGLVITRHGTTNTCELLSGKHAGGKKSDPNYDRLAYNTEFLWEDNNAEGATAMAYSIAEANGATDWAPNVGQMFVGESGGVIYRQSMLRGWMSRVDLADIPIRGGTVRVDRPRVGMAYDLRLAHYGLPHVDGAAEVRELTVQDRSAIIGKAGDRSVALVAFHGWDGVGTESHQGLNAEADQSTVIFAARSRNAHYSGMTLAVTVMLHRTDGVAFTPEDLDVIESLEVLPFAPSGAPQGARIRLRNGASYLVDFGGMEGQLQA